jgi:hypothetical protein
MLCALFGSPGTALACTILWDGGAGNAFWQTALNWDLNRLPNSTDDVCINATNVVLSNFQVHRIKSLTTAGGLTIVGSSTFLEVIAGGNIGGFLTLSGGQMVNTGVLTVNGLLTSANGALNGSGTTDAKGGIVADGNLVDFWNQTVNNFGVATLSTSVTRIRMPAGVFNNKAGATVNLLDGTGFDSLGVGSTTFNNSGTVVKQGNSDFSGTTFGLRVNNTGTITVVKGIVSFNGPFTQTAGATNLTGGAIQSFVPAMTFNGGALTGIGKLTANVLVSGDTQVAPGVNGAGRLEIVGSYTQDGGTLAVQIGGTTPGLFDQLVVSGVATLGGTVSASLTSGFQPQANDEFKVIEFASASGGFQVFAAPGFTQELNVNDFTLVADGTSLSQISINDVKIVQVFDDLVTLVQDKATAVFVTIGVTDPQALPDSGVDVELLFENRVIPDTIQKLNFILGGGVSTHIFNPALRLKPQLNPLNVTVRAARAGELATDAKKKDETRTVESKDVLRVAFVPVKCNVSVSCYSPPGDISSTISDGVEFVAATFPVPAVAPLALDKPLPGTPAFGPTILAKTIDLVSLHQLAKLSGAQRAVGVVDESYFAHHGELLDKIWGFAINGLGAIVQNEHPAAVPHELVHTFGQESHVEATLPQMYWVEGSLQFDASGYMAMGIPKQQAQQPLKSSALWIDPITYQGLVQNIGSGADPEVIEMAFAIGPGDQVEALPWYHNPNGEVFDLPASVYSAQMRSADGALLATMPFTPASTMIVGAEERQLAWKPVVISVPYPPTTATVEILKDGKGLATFIPQTKLLKDAVLDLPDGAFVIMPTQRRAALIDYLDSAETALRNQNWTTGQLQLNQFKSSLAEWLAVDYEVEDALQVGRQALDVLTTNSVERVNAIAPPALACDTDADADIDSLDLQNIRQANGLLAQPGDRRDGNQDGRINVADVRYCQLRLTSIQ